MKSQYVYDVNAPKKPVNLTANADLLQNAKGLGINLSQTFEDAVLVKLKKIMEEQWLAENEEAIEAYNARIEINGVFAASKRRF
ncbi:antitoxin CcdA [Desulfuromusa kysingii]|uniref:Antitoxin CcdA n=1 Tax=Desulfuromusa kysingii TaxID=37625 RepID=A0A1H4BB30_9BACT|nr:type II toxin-antitoxin system CcdA family antitoxin [Desulfuromusa kysingii]SEA45350.1 antitoxin CcdA [Desulfuromusa kysingii]